MIGMDAHPRILLVEDDPRVGAILAEELEAAEFVVDGPYRTLSDGMAALAEHFPDAAVLDIRLDDHDIFMLADDLEQYAIPFVLCSGLPPQGRVGLRFGHHPFVRKDAVAGLVPALDALLH